MIKLNLMQVARPLLILPAVVVWHAALAGLAPAKDDIIFLVDNSLVMQQIDNEIALPGSIRAFVEQISRNVRVALILFDENATLEVPFVAVKGKQLGEFAQGLAAVDYTDRFSNSAAALERGLHELQSDGRSGAGKSIILFTQGNIDFTDNALDLAIGGEGFFVISDDGARSYTRAGAFGVDNQGYVVNAQGARLQSYPYAGNGLFNTGTPQDLQLTIGANPPATSTKLLDGRIDDVAVFERDIPASLLRLHA